ncbi:MAG: hypothetical protein OXG97_11850 [Candidatus Poribacteria bacterium]|nr:hypothetical protein [Candidatus Poribacteria bacterium]
MIEIQSHNHASELISLSGAYLEQNESENNLPIGLAYRLAEDPYYYGSELPLLLSILEHGKVVGVSLMTPPKRIILSRINANIPYLQLWSKITFAKPKRRHHFSRRKYG